MDTAPPPRQDPTVNRRRDAQRLFSDSHSFFRSPTGDSAYVDPLAGFKVESGPEWSDAEANALLRRMLDALAEGRASIDDPDALAYAEANSLLLLIGPREEAVMQRLYTRMPAAMVERWRTALAGDRESLGFGRRRNEEPPTVDTALRDARRRSALMIGAVVITLALVGAAAIFFRPNESKAPVGRISFGSSSPTAESPDRFLGEAPLVNPNLLARLERPVAVLAGAGNAVDRIDPNVSIELLPSAPAALSATLFRYGGRGQVVIVGPAGFLTTACLQVSAVTVNLRPFDTAIYNAGATACPANVAGRPATVGCVGDTAIMFEVQFPQGDVALDEGGVAAVGGVRVASFVARPGYETLSIRGTIEVRPGKDEEVPVFGGKPGDVVSFDVTPKGATTPTIGRCALK
ncbi:MAG: hypothetical protein E6G39_12515 [Actinobacteria bacterium]|nr:MAG: hypothetical protein E6G39_12515 [Actinomycetota bacterium]